MVSKVFLRRTKIQNLKTVLTQFFIISHLNFPNPLTYAAINRALLFWHRLNFSRIFCKFVVYGISRAGNRAAGCITKI